MCLCDGYTILYFDYHCFNNSVKNNVRQQLDNMNTQMYHVENSPGL